jgi:arylsulfatase
MFGLAACARQTVQSGPATPPSAPNFLIIVADDLGWSDLAPFGGEISTPNLSELAQRGTLMTNFYVASTCAPTRAMLMTGVDNHLAGVGAFPGTSTPNQVGRNYEGQLHNGVVTLAEALRAKGYHTMLSGKWHLSLDEEQRPHNRGFDRSFTLITGGASHFADQLPIGPTLTPLYLEDGAPVQLPPDFYSSISYTDKLLEYLVERDADRPFFALLSYTAPHDPLHVPDDWMDRNKGKYDDGPAATRLARTNRLKDLGLIPEAAELWELPNFPHWYPHHFKAWEDRSDEQRAEDVRPMEIYASMIELMDDQIGRVIEALEERGELDNTYILFFSDNGASVTAPLVYPHSSEDWLRAHWDRDPLNAGRPGSFSVLGREWASAAGAPFRMYKGSVTEGGVRSPFIVTGPTVAKNYRSDSLSHVTDIVPTLFELVGLIETDEPIYDNKELPSGASLLPAWSAGANAERKFFATEYFGNGAVRRDNWKAVYFTDPSGLSGRWELFDLSADPGETSDLAGAHPDVLNLLISDYDTWSETVALEPPQPSPYPNLRRVYPRECGDWCEQMFTDFDEIRKARMRTEESSTHE